MRYKIELRYVYGWDDAGWSVETNGKIVCARFGTIAAAQAALDEFFTDVKMAVAAGNMDSEADRADYRIAAVLPRLVRGTNLNQPWPYISLRVVSGIR